MVRRLNGATMKLRGQFVLVSIALSALSMGQAPYALEMQRRSAPASASVWQTNSPEVSETIQLLSRFDVQKDLAITAEEYSQLSTIASRLSGQLVSEDSVRTSVAAVLTAAQAKRLTELLVQSMGYGSLALADVREKLNLTDTQQSRISDTITQYDNAKRLLRSSAASTQAATQALSSLKLQANELLAKVLTADQDKALRALAGKALGS